jgi:DNA-binding MarR family transcriptional regulator
MERAQQTTSDARQRPRGRAGGPPPAARAAYLLSQIGRSQATGLTERLRPLGLRPRHFALLNIIAVDEGRSQQQLGERLALEPSGIVPTIDELQQQALLERRRDPADRRRYALHLTPDGRAKLAQARLAAAQQAAELFEPLDQRELHALHEMLTRVAAAADANLRALGG